MKYITPTLLICALVTLFAVGQKHSDNDQPLDFGTGVASDGESIRTAFPKINEDLRYLFNLRDITPICSENVAAMQLLSTVGANPTLQDGDVIITKGFDAAGDGGWNRYRYDAASTDFADGAVVVSGPGGVGRFIANRWRRELRPEAFPGATMGAKFGALINYINDNGGNGGTTGDPGFLIRLDGEYDLTGITLPRILRDHVYVSGSSVNSKVEFDTATLFVWGGDQGTDLIVVGGGLSNCTLQYSGASASAVCVQQNHATDLKIENVRINGIPRFYVGNGENGNVCSNTHIRMITGECLNVANPLISTQSDTGAGICAGIRVTHCNVFVTGVPVPDQTDQDDELQVDASRQFVLVNGKADTVVVSDNITNRFGTGVSLQADEVGVGTSIVKVYDNYFDFCKVAGVSLEHQGGNINHVEIDRNWLNAQDGTGVLFNSTAATGLFQNIQIRENRVVTCGINGVFIDAMATNVVVDGLDVNGTGRRSGSVGFPVNTHGVLVESGASGFEIHNVRVEDMTDEAGKALLPNNGVYVDANCDNYLVSEINISATNPIEVIADTLASTNRAVRNVTGSKFTNEETILSGGTLPTNDTDVFNTTPFTKTVYVTAGGANYLGLKVQSSNGAYRTLGSTGARSITVGPGEAWRVLHNSGGTGVTLIEHIDP